MRLYERYRALCTRRLKKMNPDFWLLKKCIHILRLQKIVGTACSDVFSQKRLNQHFYVEENFNLSIRKTRKGWLRKLGVA